MKELIEKLRTFTVPELCDGCADPNVMDYRIKPAFGTPHICGRAVTLDIPEGIAGKVSDAIMELKEGDILVIAGKGWQKKRRIWNPTTIIISMRHMPSCPG